MTMSMNMNGMRIRYCAVRVVQRSTRCGVFRSLCGVPVESAVREGGSLVVVPGVRAMARVKVLVVPPVAVPCVMSVVVDSSSVLARREANVVTVLLVRSLHFGCIPTFGRQKQFSPKTRTRLFFFTHPRIVHLRWSQSA